jgi:serine/threonine protein kinase
MAVRLDVQSFIRDYCNGVKDKDLIDRHHLKAKELVAIVKKLLKDGTITKQQYFERNRKIQELEASQEAEFLRSLHHCLTCGHAQPIPFTVCPACGTEAFEPQESGTAPDPSVSEPVAQQTPPHEPEPEPAFSDSARQKLGMPLENVTWIDGFAGGDLRADYVISEVFSDDQLVTVFKAEGSSDDAPILSVRMFHAENESRVKPDEFLNRIKAYQSAMTDRNILTMIGTATLAGESVALSEFIPTTLEDLLKESPTGLPLDFLVGFLPQLLNAVGYSHMHRGMDGSVRRLPHMLLKTSVFLFNERSKVLKLADCGVWKARVDLGGYKDRLWQDPGVDLSGLSPECFVVSGRAVNAFSADIYSLGTVLYKLTTGKSAFSAATVEEYNFVHLKTFPVPPRVHRYSVPAWLDAMILKCLEKEPANRWRSATQMELSIRRG